MKWYSSKKILALVILAFFGSTIIGYAALKLTLFSAPDTTYITDTGEKVKRVNILLMGVDARPGETKSRTDTLIFASIDPETKSVAILSIPRDTRVNIPGKGYDKINSANVRGGVELTTQVVEELLGVPIHYYVLTNFDGFKEIIDTLGGVTIDVEKNMLKRDEGINLKKGMQKMDGDKALQYVRFRSDALGDIGRTQRQQKFIKAIADEMLTLKTITKLPKLLPQISKAVQTNMSKSDMVRVASLAKGIEADKIVTQTLPGNFYNYKGISYWAVDEEYIKGFVQVFIISGKTEDMIDEGISTKNSSSASTNKKTVNTEQPKAQESTKPEATTPITTQPQKPKDNTTTINKPVVETPQTDSPSTGEQITPPPEYPQTSSPGEQPSGDSGTSIGGQTPTSPEAPQTPSTGGLGTVNP